MGIRNILRIKTRKRNHDCVGISFDRNLVRLADVDKQVAALGHSLRNIFRRQIVNLVRHSYPPTDLSALTCAYSIPKMVSTFAEYARV